MSAYDDYLLVKRASSLFSPHQRMGLQIGRMFERTKGKSQATQGVMSSQNGRGPMSMNEIALQKEQDKFQKEKGNFDKQQKEVQILKEELEHKQRVWQRQKELEELEKNRPKPEQGSPDVFTSSLNAHAKGTVQRFRSTLERLLKR